ncbi:MAG: Mrp/NBP35 family ATP-binding protein [Bacteroidetes bacterium]|nr:Mrp/NBP35 family ATP-binding protein [Bacteroidota bacterium]
MSYLITELEKALSQVIDPDFDKDIVSLRMVEDMNVTGQVFSFTLVLTTPACPLKDQFKADVERAVASVYPDLSVELNFTSRVTTPRQENQDMLKGIRNILLVSSGKGGVGKTTVAVNLAVALGQSGAKVGLLDADIHGPSIPTMLGATSEKPGMIQDGTKYKMIPVQKFGIQVLSMGMLVDPKQPLIFRGPMQSSALKQLMLDVEWGELDYLIIDLPPGTGDIHLSLAQQFPVTGALVVTSPQQVSVSDTRKSIEMFNGQQTKVPIVGIVENMSWFTPEDHPTEKYYIFGSGGGNELAEEYNLPLLAQIPIVLGLDQRSDQGIPAVLNRNPEMSQYFKQMAQSVAQHIAILNAKETVLA